MDDAIPVPPALDAFVRRNDPEHIQLINDMRDVKKAILHLTEAEESTQKRLLGEWDDERREWRPGLLQEMQSLNGLLARAIRLGGWALGIATTIGTASIITLITLALQNHAHIQQLTTSAGH